MRLFSTFAFAAALSTAAVPALAQASKSIELLQPWAPATPGGARTGAVYMTVKNLNSDGDRLVGGSSPVAQKVQVHQMSVSNGVMHMRELAHGLAVPAGGSVALTPGSYHVMLVGLQKPLKAGATFPLTLDFQKAGNVSVDVPVRPIGATESGAGSDTMNMETR